MKIKLTESQIKRLLSDKNKFILVEQKKWNKWTFRDFEVMASGWLDKNVGRPIEKWADGVWYGKGQNKYRDHNKFDGLSQGYIGGEKIPFLGWTDADWRKFWGDNKQAIEEIPEIPESSVKLFKYLTDGKNWGEVAKGVEYGVNTVTDKSPTEHFDDVKSGFFMLFDKIKKDIVDPVVTFSKECASDWHCIVDVASIAVLAIPGIGLALSAGIDILHAGTYAYAYSQATTPAEKSEALIAGGLTLFGGLMGGGVKQTKYLIKEAKANKNIYKYTGDVIELVKSNKEITESSIKNLQKKYKLTQKELEISTEILDNMSKFDPKLVNRYVEAVEALSKDLTLTQRANLKNIMGSKKFNVILNDNNNNVIESLNIYLKKVARREAVMEASLFTALTVAMEQPSVQEFVATAIKWYKYKDRKDIRGRVEKEGYNWKGTKEVFGSDSKIKDNELLTQAWNEGWRPYPMNIKNPGEKEYLESRKWIKEHPKYQTKTFKESLKKIDKEIKNMVDDKPIYLPIPQGDSENLPDDIKSLIPKDAQQIELKYIDNDTGDDWYEDAFGEK